MSYYDTDRLKQGFFIVLILLLGGVLFWKGKDFIPAFLGALTLYVILRPAVFYLVYKRRWRRSLTAVLLILLSFIVLMVPLALMVNMMTARVSFVIEHSADLISGLQRFAAEIKLNTHFDILSPDTVKKVQDALTNFLPKFLGSTFNVFTTLFIMYFILYFMLLESRRMEYVLYEYIPLKEANVDRLGIEVKNMVVSNAVGIPLLGVVQGLFAALGYWVFGVQDILFWGVVTGFMSMVPVVGTAVVWVPLSIFLIVNEATWMGIGLLIYGAIVIVNLDNVFRFIWQKKVADVHPLVTVFGVLIGISLFGFVGIIFGPLLISMFILLLKIYGDEFGVKKHRVKVVSK
jgi:predicted PurR-regulated permease PerM